MFVFMKPTTLRVISSLQQLQDTQTLTSNISQTKV